MSENKRKVKWLDVRRILNSLLGGSIEVGAKLTGTELFDNSADEDYVQYYQIKGETGNGKVSLDYNETDIDEDTGNVVIRAEDLPLIEGLGLIYAYVGEQYINGAYLERSDNTVPGFGGYIGSTGLTIELTFI